MSDGGVLRYTVHSLPKLGDSAFKNAISDLVTLLEVQRKENALRYYEPVSQNALKIHQSEAKTVGVFGGNRSSKTESCLVEMVILCTGIVPASLQKKGVGIDWEKKLRGPIQCRVVCESLTTVLHPIILPKLQWWKWLGVDRPGGERGHYGWVPKNCLMDGLWERSWSEKLRILRVLYRDWENPERVLGESTIQFLSKDQDASDFASGTFHMILEDEPPNLAIWRENETRTMDVNGRHFLAMTWPDDPAIAVDWINDEIYEPGMSDQHTDIDCITLDTTENLNIDQGAVAIQAAKWSEEIRQVRIHGGTIRFSNRIHPLFTDAYLWWCFACKKRVIPVAECCTCGSRDIVMYNHVLDFEPKPWPTVFLLDPHPRKPHMFIWIQVSPQDDLWQIAEAECAGDCNDVAEMVSDLEMRLGLDVSWRYIDPNMGRSPASTKRGITWQDEFDSVGLVCDLASDSDVGRSRVNEYLRPDPNTKDVRMHINANCQDTIKQFKRYRWADFRQALEKDLKQKPMERYDDYPTLWKYLLNSDPTFQFARHGAPILRRRA